MNNNEYTFCELREKEVVNTVDGRRLGRIVDMAFSSNGRIFGIIVPGSKRVMKSLGSGDSLFIPWRNICRIGTDVILVELMGNCGARIMSDDETAPPEAEK